MIQALRPLRGALLIILLAFGRSGAAAQSQTPRENAPQRVAFAVRATASIHVDGVLDEPDWEKAPPASEFVQRDPHEGEKATEKTEVRVLFDDKALFLGVKAFDREPSRIIINSLEQDFVLDENDGFSVYLDTFHDKRNGYAFFINPAGAKYETQFVGEGKENNLAWEDVWDVKTTISAEGWFAELRIPFRSLRFSQDTAQTWGINFQRRIRRRNEQSFWSPLPRRYSGYHISSGGLLEGLEIAPTSRNLRIKPFLKANVSRIRAIKTSSDTDEGLDLKYGISSGLTLDATVNTEFSQVEVDEQQINLSRFSLFFPEKRDFFLENAGIFSFGQTDVGSSSPRSGSVEQNSDILPFFSRRIGLSALGQPVPIWAGARVSGHQGEYSLGLLNIQSRESGGEPSNNFTVVRVKRNILAYSEIGGLVVNRQADQAGSYNRTFGLDSSFRFWRNLRILSFLAGTRTPALAGRNTAGRLWAEWKTNLVEVHSGYLDIGKNFNAEVGFVPRRDIRKSDSVFGLHPRLTGNRWIREFFPNISQQYITDHSNRLLTRVATLQFRTDFQNGAIFTLDRVLTFERLDAPFFIHRPIKIDPGDYNFNQWTADLKSNPSRRFAAGLRYGQGDFWDGKKSSWQISFSLKPHYKFSVSGKFSQDDVKLLHGDFLSRLASMRLNYSFSTKMFVSALLQYNSDLRKVSSNVRLDLIHRPLSDIFLVYNEQRDSFQNGAVDRSLTFKYTHMLDLF